MNKGKTRKSIIKRGIAVGLIAVMASITPMQDVRPMGANVAKAATTDSASQEKAPYIGEVRLAVDEKADKAKQILESAGYEVIDQDLNEKAGSWWNKQGDQAVYMGIKRTDDKKKAIRDMKTMNMLGKYSYSDLKSRIEESKSDAKETYDKLNAAIKEYTKNYNSGDKAAKQAHDLMNVYREDDSGKLIGDLFLEDNSQDQIIKIFVEGNVYSVSALGRSLTYGAEESNKDGDNWLERISKVTSYSALVKKYAKELYGKETVVGEEKEKVEKTIESDLNSTARTFLEKWGEIRKVFTEEDENLEASNEFFEDDKEEKSIIEFSGNLADATAAVYSRSVKYGKKTLYDFFTVAPATFEKNIKNLYPFVYALSEGQRALAGTMNISDLFQAAFIRMVEKEQKNKLEKEQEKVSESVLKKQETISIYEGVDRDQFSDNAALTAAATAEMSAKPVEDTMTNKVLRGLETFLKCCLGLSLFVTGAYILDWVGVKLDVNKLTEMKELARTSSEFSQTDYDRIGTELKKSKRDLVEVKTSFKYSAYVLLAVVIIFAIVETVQYVRAQKQAYNHEQLPIPEILVDYDVENKAGRYVTYHVVKWNKTRKLEGKEKPSDRADRGDLNGDAAREWLALYTTNDNAMGAPILADSIVVNVGNDSQPASDSGTEFEPLTRFGMKSIQNLVDSNYSYYDKVGGIWLWYQRAASDDKTVIDDTDNGGAVSGEASATGSHIGGTNMMLFTLGGGVAGLIIGVFIGYFTRRKKQPNE